MLLQMNTMNRKNFLAELARCKGSVQTVRPDGTTNDTGKMLLSGKTDPDLPLKLTLKIQQPGDYMRLACFAIGDV